MKGHGSLSTHETLLSMEYPHAISMERLMLSWLEMDDREAI